MKLKKWRKIHGSKSYETDNRKGETHFRNNFLYYI